MRGTAFSRAEEGQEIVKRTLPVDEHAAVLAPYDVGFLVAVGDLADQRLEDVLQGDDAARYAEFVAHDAVAELFAAQLLQRAVYLGPLVEELGGRKVVADVESGVVDMSEQVFQVDDACELVEAPFADGIAVVGLPVDLFAGSVPASSRCRSIPVRCGRS